MKREQTKKLCMAGILCAVAVVGSTLSVPVFGSKCAPVQHMVNVLCAVLLGPGYGVGVAFCASLIRNLLALGSILAFPGSMFGALLCGVVYWKSKNLLLTLLGEVFGTAILGGLCAYPLAVLVMGVSAGEVAFYAYVLPFFVSTAGGVRKHAPLIHNMTTRVSINDCANILLACGASPIMAEAIEEVEEITAMCDGLVLNMGMPNRQKIEAMKKAGKRANALHIPVVLDPVGVGASAFRREAVSELLKEVRFTVIRGNLSEIRTLMCGVCGTRGVDAEPADLMGEKNLYQNVKMVTAFAEKSGAVVAATGKNDIVSDGRKAYWIQNGHSMMQTVTGVGCQLSALTAAYVAANPKHTLEAVTAAVRAARSAQMGAP